jgi:hypothetical protein
MHFLNSFRLNIFSINVLKGICNINWFEFYGNRQLVIENPRVFERQKCNIITSKKYGTKGFFSSPKQKLISCKFHPKHKKIFSECVHIDVGECWGSDCTWWWREKDREKEKSWHLARMSALKIAYACRALDFISLKSFIWKIFYLIAALTSSNRVVASFWHPQMESNYFCSLSLARSPVGKLKKKNIDEFFIALNLWKILLVERE